MMYLKRRGQFFVKMYTYDYLIKREMVHYSVHSYTNYLRPYFSLNHYR